MLCVNLLLNTRGGREVVSSQEASRPSHPSSTQQQVEQFSVINLTWTVIAHLWDPGPRLCKITVADGAEGGSCRSACVPQTTAREMRPRVTPNTTSTVSEQGGRGGGRRSGGGFGFYWSLLHRAVERGQMDLLVLCAMVGGVFIAVWTLAIVPFVTVLLYLHVCG